MWARMLVRINEFRSDRQGLGTLVDDLRGLYVEADPHDMAVRTEFEVHWAPIDGENELRTESWAPPGCSDGCEPGSGLKGV